MSSASYENQVVSTLRGDIEYLERVQEGFSACVTSGTAVRRQLPAEDVAGKTGTAEVGDSTSTALIGYAPYEDPRCGVCLHCADLFGYRQQSAGNVCTTEVMGPVLEKYFELYPDD